MDPQEGSLTSSLIVQMESVRLWDMPEENWTEEHLMLIVQLKKAEMVVTLEEASEEAVVASVAAVVVAVEVDQMMRA